MFCNTYIFVCLFHSIFNFDEYSLIFKGYQFHLIFFKDVMNAEKEEIVDFHFDDCEFYFQQ